VENSTKDPPFLHTRLLFFTNSAQISPVKSFPLFNKALRHKGVLGSRGIALGFLYVGTRWMSSFRFSCCTNRGMVPGTCWVGGCVGVRGCLDPLPGIEILLVGPSNPWPDRCRYRAFCKDYCCGLVTKQWYCSPPKCVSLFWRQFEWLRR
jgi:hypothetical protein